MNLLLINVSANTSRRLIQAITVKRIDIWDAGNGVTPSNTPVIEWFSNNTQRKIYNAPTVGTAQAGHVFSSPPANSPAAFPSTNGTSETEPLFQLTCGTASVIDLLCEVCIASDQLGAMSTVTTTAAGTTGVIYYFNLDGTTGVVQPQNFLARIT
jgi:hypothetical protein